MYSSVKFFEPSTIAGLPLPGCAAAVDPELDSELFLLLDPQAARPIASATAKRAIHPLYHVRPVMRPLLRSYVASSTEPLASIPPLPRSARGVTYRCSRAKNPSAANASAETRSAAVTTPTNR